MGLSRRMFTKEFKLAAFRRLEQGISMGEVARALEVNPNVLHRWRREFRQGPGNAYPGNESVSPHPIHVRAVAKEGTDVGRET